MKLTLNFNFNQRRISTGINLPQKNSNYFSGRKPDKNVFSRDNKYNQNHTKFSEKSNLESNFRILSTNRITNKNTNINQFEGKIERPVPFENFGKTSSNFFYANSYNRSTNRVFGKSTMSAKNNFPNYPNSPNSSNSPNFLFNPDLYQSNFFPNLSIYEKLYISSQVLKSNKNINPNNKIKKMFYGNENEKGTGNGNRNGNLIGKGIENVSGNRNESGRHNHQSSKFYFVMKNKKNPLEFAANFHSYPYFNGHNFSTSSEKKRFKINFIKLMELKKQLKKDVDNQIEITQIFIDKYASIKREIPEDSIKKFINFVLNDSFVDPKVSLRDIIIRELNLNYDSFNPVLQNYGICTTGSNTKKFITEKKIKTSKNFYKPNETPENPNNPENSEIIFSLSKDTDSNFNNFKHFYEDSRTLTSSISSQSQTKFDPRMNAQKIPKMNYEPHRLDKIITNYKKIRDDKLQKLKTEKFQQKNWLELMKINRQQPKNKVVLEDIMLDKIKSKKYLLKHFTALKSLYSESLF